MMTEGVLRMKPVSHDLKHGVPSQQRASMRLHAARKVPRSTFTRRVDDYSGNALNPPAQPQVQMITAPLQADSTTIPALQLPTTASAVRLPPTVDPMSVLSALRTLGRDGIPFDSSSICTMLQRCSSPSVLQQLSTAQLCSAVAELGRLRLVPAPFPFLQAVMARIAADDFQSLTPRQLCCSLLWGLAAAGVQPLSTTWLLAALRALHAAVDDMDARCIYTLCTALEAWGVMEIIQQDGGVSRSRVTPAVTGSSVGFQTTDPACDTRRGQASGADESSLSHSASNSAAAAGQGNERCDASGQGADLDAGLEDCGEDEDEDDLLLEWRSLIETSPVSEVDSLGGGEGSVDRYSMPGASNPETNVVISVGRYLVDRLWLRMVQNLDACTLHELGAVMCMLGSSIPESDEVAPGQPSLGDFQHRDSHVSNLDAAAVLLAVEDLLLVCTDTEEVEQVRTGLLRMGIQVPAALQRTFRLRHQWRS